MSNDPYHRKTPPETDSEWQGIWKAIEKAEKSWIIVGPIYAVVTNWKALVIIGGIVLFVNGGDFIEYIKLIWEGRP